MPQPGAQPIIEASLEPDSARQPLQAATSIRRLPLPDSSCADMETGRSIGACVACYRGKERCQQGCDQQACSRCSRLGKPCHPRTRKQFGRPPLIKGFSHGTSGLFSQQPVEAETVSASRGIRSSTSRISGPVPSPSPGLSLMHGVHGVSHRQLKNLLTTDDGFFRLHRHWLIAKSLAPHYQHTVRRLFGHSPLVLANAYQCVLDLLDARDLEFREPEAASTNLSRGASCLRELVRSPGTLRSAEDAALVLMLGQVLFVYNVLISWPCTHVIVRSTLLTAREWYPTLLQVAEWDPATVTPVFVDTVQCLVRREVPVLRLPLGGRLVVDRLLGISSSLLPLLYDLCACSHRVKTHAPVPIPASPTDAQEADDDAYSAVERQIRSWEPIVLPECRYTSVETSALLAQARMYKTAGLVLIHRLRHPLGVADELKCARSILNDLSTFTWNIGSQDASGIGSNFLLLLGTLELPEKGNALIRALEPHRFGPKQYIQILEFVDYVKVQRNCGFHGLWFDLVEDRLGVTLP